MESLSLEQLDLFDGKLFPEFIYAEKIRDIEENQTKLRKSLFGRWSEQEKKINTLTDQVGELLDILSKKEEISCNTTF